MFALLLTIALATNDSDAQVRAWTAGYNARYKHHLPRSANPYPIPLVKDREWWDDGWSWKGWMPDWREFIPNKQEHFAMEAIDRDIEIAAEREKRYPPRPKAEAEPAESITDHYGVVWRMSPIGLHSSREEATCK